jgi:hypothetical protein
MCHPTGVPSLGVLTSVDPTGNGTSKPLQSGCSNDDAEAEGGRDGRGVEEEEGGGGISVLRTREAFFLGFGAITQSVDTSW